MTSAQQNDGPIILAAGPIYQNSSIVEGLRSSSETNVSSRDNFNSAVTKENGKYILGVVKTTHRSEKSKSEQCDAQMYEGNYLFMPEADMTVNTPMGQVLLRRHTAAFVIANRGELSVYNLNESSKGGVSVVYNQHKLEVALGRQALISNKSSNDFATANPEQRIAWRAPRIQSLDANTKAYIAEFSIATALKNIEPLRQMMNDKNGPGQKDAMRLLKNAVLIATMSGPNYVSTLPSD